jgi:diaminopimelate epimerase
MRIPFTKAHGAKNDFLLTWAYEAPRSGLPETARAICDRNTGVGADGWILITPAASAGPAWQAAIRLFNADGSEPELSGNGTRCAAAFLLDSGAVPRGDVRLLTGAGVKHLHLVKSSGLCYEFEMNMGKARLDGDQVSFPLPLAAGPTEVTSVNVGNPQCAVFVDSFPADWATLGAEIERHLRFPQRTNVSFVHAIDRHTLDVRFYERGVGVTFSSGTGSTGAVAAAMFRGLVDSPVRVLTPAGPLDLRIDESYYLTGPAEITAGGEYYYERT